MGALVDVILPVFLIIGFGYTAAWRKFFSESAIDGLMLFAQSFAVPCLLFLAISKIDLSAAFSLPLMVSFYVGAFAGFALGFLGACYFFNRSLEDSIAIGFCALFSNTVLLGLPITERAYGLDALTGNFAIVSVHALVIYGFGVTFMEIARGRTSGGDGLVLKVLRAMLSNPLMIGILFGFLVNLTNLMLPAALLAGLTTMASAALPAALFGLGGVMYRYRPEGDMKTIAWITAISLIAHPTITYTLGTKVFSLDQAQLRSAVLTAAMAPGINTFLFANMYGVAQRVAASTVLVATALSIITIWVWLIILP